jgi:hypothetical protein
MDWRFKFLAEEKIRLNGQDYEKFAERIWENSAGIFLIILVMCFFCKKKSRNEMERQYDARASPSIF